MGPRVALVGFMGCGKTTTGRLLARHLGFGFVDTDVLIEGKCGMPIREIFRVKGEPFFRQVEREVLNDCLASERQVLATGGGLWVNDENRSALLGGAWCVHLRVSPECVWERVRGNLAERPLLAAAEDPLAKIQELLAVRAPLYALAHVQVDTDGKLPDRVVREVVEHLKERRPFDLPPLPI